MRRLWYLPTTELSFSTFPSSFTTKSLRCASSTAVVWQLGKNDDYEVLNFQIQRENYRPDACGSKYGGQLNLYGNKPPYKLHITIGDPDSGDAIQFERSGVS
jgi:hypothetical protein